jgi:hypothetical protein
MADPENAGRLVSDAVANAAKEALDAVGADEAMLRRRFTLEFSEGGKHAEDQSSLRPRRVDGSALAGQHLEADAVPPQIIDNLV